MYYIQNGKWYYVLQIENCLLEKESAIPKFGIRIQSLLDVSNIPNYKVHANVIPQVPPWTMHNPKVFLDLSFAQERHSISFLHSKFQ